MKYAVLPALGRPCSKLVLGSMAFDLARMEHWHRLLDAFVDLGGNCIDTAFIYRGGESEQVIGDWITRRGLEGEVLILTKGAHPIGDGKPRVRPECIEHDLSVSLERLQVETIDLYVLHRDDETVPVGEIVDALNRQLHAGKIRAFGGSNWSVARLEEANDYARRHGLTGFTVSSPNLSLAYPNEPRWPGCISVSVADLEWYERHQMPLFSWSSQASGFFTGRFTPDGRENPEIVRVYYSEENWRRYARAQRLAEELGVTTNSVALAYVLSQPFPTFALIGPVNEDELRSSLPALHVSLSQEQVKWLDGRVIHAI